MAELMQEMLKGLDAFIIRHNNAGTDVQDQTNEPEMEQVTEAEASTNAEILAERNEPQEVGKQIDGILTTHNSTNEKENAEPSRGLDDDSFYVKIAEILKSAKPDNVEVMVRVIVEMMAQYNGTQDSGNKVGASHGEEKGVDAGDDTQGEGSFGRGGVPLDQGEFVESQETFSGKGKAGEQQGPDLQTERLASRHRSHSRVGSLAFRGPPDHGRAMRHQLLNPVPDPWSQI